MGASPAWDHKSRCVAARVVKWNIGFVESDIRAIVLRGRGSVAKPYNMQGEANDLWSEASAPVERGARSWTSIRHGCAWAAMSVCLPLYLLASGLTAMGMGAGPLLVTILAGSMLVAVISIGCGHAAIQYGIPFAVLLRVSFGVLGARVPLALRTFVGCGWLGIVCWLGGQTLLALVRMVAPGVPQEAGWVCFSVFLLVAAIVPNRGWKMLTGAWLSAALLLITLLVLWLILDERSGVLLPVNGHGLPQSMGKLSLPRCIGLCVTGIVGLWMPVAIGSADVTCRVISQRAHVYGTSAMPVAATLFCGLALSIAGAAISRGLSDWNLIVLASHLTEPLTAVPCLAAILAALLLTARPACDWLGQQASAAISSRVATVFGSWMVCLVAVLCRPWRLLADPQSYIAGWLTGCAAMLMPVAAILLVEYFALRRRWLNVDDLYQRDGLYEYAAGWNWRAFAAGGVGWCFMLGVVLVPRLRDLRESGVWLGTGVTAVLYWTLRSGPPDVALIPPTPLLIPLTGFEGEGASG